MGDKSAGKIDICFYHYCPAGRSSKKRGWLWEVPRGGKSWLRKIRASAQGAKPDPKLQQCEKFHSGAA
jgi:hypothetical protein